MKCYFCSVALCGAETGDTSEIRTAVPRKFRSGVLEKGGEDQFIGCVKNKVIHSHGRNILLTYLLTYSMEQSPSCEANRFCS